MDVGWYPEVSLPILFVLFCSVRALHHPQTYPYFPRNRHPSSPEDIWLRFGASASLVNNPAGSSTELHSRGTRFARTTTIVIHGREAVNSPQQPTLPFSGPGRVLLGIESAASLAAASCDLTRNARLPRQSRSGRRPTQAVCVCVTIAASLVPSFPRSAAQAS